MIAATSIVTKMPLATIHKCRSRHKCSVSFPITTDFTACPAGVPAILGWPELYQASPLSGGAADQYGRRGKRRPPITEAKIAYQLLLRRPKRSNDNDSTAINNTMMRASIGSDAGSSTGQPPRRHPDSPDGKITSAGGRAPRVFLGQTSRTRRTHPPSDRVLVTYWDPPVEPMLPQGRTAIIVHRKKPGFRDLTQRRLVRQYSIGSNKHLTGGLLAL